MKTNFHIIISVSLLLSTAIIAQEKWKQNRIDGFFGIGAINYYGDIGGTSSSKYFMSVTDTKPANIGISAYCGATYRYSVRFASKLNIYYGFMRGSDGSSFSGRNISFTSHLLETSTQLEYSIISQFLKKKQLVTFNKEGKLNMMNPYNLYVFAGIGNVLFLPSVKNDTRSSAKELNSLGSSLIFPLGIGVKWNRNDILSLGIEIGGRYTMSDFIDGIDLQGSNSNDTYYFTTISFNYKIKTNRNGWPVMFERIPKLFTR